MIFGWIRRKLLRAKKRRARRNIRKKRFIRSVRVVGDFDGAGGLLDEAKLDTIPMRAATLYERSGSIAKKEINTVNSMPATIRYLNDAVVYSRTDGFEVGGTLFHPDIYLHDIQRHDLKNQNFGCEVTNSGWTFFYSPRVKKACSRKRAIVQFAEGTLKQLLSFFTRVFTQIPAFSKNGITGRSGEQAWSGKG